MAKLIYSAITSLDGYIEDKSGRFDWATPDQELFAFVNELERPIGTYLYGRRMYETMVYWENPPAETADSAEERDYTQVWRAAEKIVYSRTLEKPSSERTRIERDLDAAKIRRLKETSASDLSVGGSELAHVLFRAGLIDEIHLFLNPIIVGGGKCALPDDVRIALELLGERRFDSGVVHVHYGIRIEDS